MNLIKCAGEFLKRTFLLTIIVATGVSMIPSLSANAQEKDNELSITVSLNAAQTLTPGTEYTKAMVNEIVTSDVCVNGVRDTISSVSYYCLPSETFATLTDKSEAVVKQYDGFTTTDELIDGYAVLPVTFVVYHTFENDDQSSETVMATDEIIFVITQSALDVVETYKTGNWYETSENGVNWKFTINDDGKIDKLYTESTCLDGYIVDGVFMVPATVNNIPVIGIGSGSDTPFVPQSVLSYTEIEFPLTLQEIGDYAFYKNSVCTEITFGRTLLKIGKKAFYSSNLGSVTITGDTTVDELAFANSRCLEKVNMFGHVTVLKRAFDGGTYGSLLQSVVMTESVSLGEMAFCNNQSITELTVTKGTVMDITSFQNCENIGKVIVNGDADIPEGTFGEAKISYQS